MSCVVHTFIYLHTCANTVIVYLFIYLLFGDHRETQGTSTLSVSNHAMLSC